MTSTLKEELLDPVHIMRSLGDVIDVSDLSAGQPANAPGGGSKGSGRTDKEEDSHTRYFDLG